MVQWRRSPEDLGEWPMLSYVGNWGDGQVLTLMVNSFQMTHHLQADVSATESRLNFWNKLHIQVKN
jgi:hypothetical protein